MEIRTRFGRGPERVVHLAIGRAYVIEPINPQAKRFRGRPCILLGVDDPFMPSKATVKFTDTNKGGQPARVNCSDLVDSPDQVGVHAAIDRAVQQVAPAAGTESALDRALEGVQELQRLRATDTDIVHFLERIRPFIPAETVKS